MITLSKAWGIQAKVFLSYNGSLDDLAKKFAKRFCINDFMIDTEEEYPHESFAMFSCMGFTIWIHNSSIHQGFAYEVEVRTQNEPKDLKYRQICDISLWLARYIYNFMHTETYALDVDVNEYCLGSFLSLNNI